MAFIDARLNQDKEFGFVGGPEFNTDKRRLRSGVMKRRRLWDYPIHKYTADYATFDEAERAVFLDFFMAAAGSWAAMRFRDENDYKAVNQPFGLGDGTSATLQLVRVYAKGGLSLVRPIHLPLDVVVTDQDGNILAVTVNPLTGKVTPVSPWPVGKILYWNGQFDVRVCLSMDFNPFTRIEADVGELTIELEEDRI